jgi:hypothetical protein
VANSNWKGTSVKKINLFLGICLALPVLAAACGEGTAPAVQVNGEVGVSSAVALTEARIDGVVGSMDIMAVTDEVVSAEWDSMVNILTEFEETSIPLVAWFALPDGSYYTVDAGKVSANISDRAYFPKVMAGETVIGNLVVSKSTGRDVMVAVVPVMSGGDVIGALGVSVYLDQLSQLIAGDMELPDDMVLYAVSGDGLIALHTDANLIMEDSSALGGGPEQAVSKVSSLLGWTFTLGLIE